MRITLDTGRRRLSPILAPCERPAKWTGLLETVIRLSLEPARFLPAVLFILPFRHSRFGRQVYARLA
jgi:hypothetical protein